MNVLDAIASPDHLGRLPAFRDLVPWRPWFAFLRAVYGVPMDSGDLATFRRFTGRTTPRPGGYPEAVVITGSRSGKSTIAATVAAWEAVNHGKPGTYALLVAQDQRSAQRTLLDYSRAPFTLFPGDVESETSDTVRLTNGCSLAVYPCRPAAVRGITATVAVVDELAFFITTDGKPTDREMLRVARTRLATTEGKLLILSSPYGQSGALWDLHRRHFGRENSTSLVWQASAPEMNPTLPTDYLARMEQDDPEAYRSEVLGEFRAGVSSLFDSESLAAVTDAGTHERLPDPGTRVYAAHFDASGGRQDAAALCIGHRNADLVVLDCLRRWPAPHNPETIIGEAADVLRSFHLSRVQVDRYAESFVASAFSRQRIRADPARRTTAEHFLGLLPIINAEKVRLLDRPDALRELRGLERRRGAGGRDTIVHPRGGHDDAAAAVAGAVALLAGKREPGDVGITIEDSAPAEQRFCYVCRGGGLVGTGSVEAPRSPCPACVRPV